MEEQQVSESDVRRSLDEDNLDIVTSFAAAETGVSKQENNGTIDDSPSNDGDDKIKNRNVNQQRESTPKESQDENATHCVQTVKTEDKDPETFNVTMNIPEQPDSQHTDTHASICKTQKETINQLQEEKRRLEEEMKALTDERDIYNRALKCPENKIKNKYAELLTIVKVLNKEKEQLANKLQEEKRKGMERPFTAPVNYAREYKDMQQRLEAMKTEKESLMQRLSMVAGLKMKDNNPSIADLSDPNRPEKLAEQFREIYDNAWTDVLDHITDKSKVSDEIAVKQIVDALQYTGGKDGHDPLLKIIKNLVQGSAERILDDVVKMIKNEPKIKELIEYGGKSGDIFITKCSNMCLFMCVQDPPVFLDFDCKKGAPFNKEKFNPFTTTGDIVDYLVWPAMYLSENGVVMSKGIAQGMKKT